LPGVTADAQHLAGIAFAKQVLDFPGFLLSFDAFWHGLIINELVNG
jgi:hypothetical protein